MVDRAGGRPAREWFCGGSCGPPDRVHRIRTRRKPRQRGRPLAPYAGDFGDRV